MQTKIIRRNAMKQIRAILARVQYVTVFKRGDDMRPDVQSTSTRNELERIVDAGSFSRIVLTESSTGTFEYARFYSSDDKWYTAWGSQAAAQRALTPEAFAHYFGQAKPLTTPVSEVKPSPAFQSALKRDMSPVVLHSIRGMLAATLH